MHPKILALRQFEALKKTWAAMAIIADRDGVPMPEMEQQRDPEVGQMLRWEAVATFVETVATLPAPTAQIDVNSFLSIEGLSKTSIKAIKAHFGVIDGDTE